MGVAMGLSAILIIRSPMGKRSGAHFNPAITLTYLRLSKITIWDATFYVVFQFLGGIFGVAISWLLLGKRLADPAVDYAVTVPGIYGTRGAFCCGIFHGCTSDGSRPLGRLTVPVLRRIRATSLACSLRSTSSFLRPYPDSASTPHER